MSFRVALLSLLVCLSSVLAFAGELRTVVGKIKYKPRAKKLYLVSGDIERELMFQDDKTSGHSSHKFIRDFLIGQVVTAEAWVEPDSIYFPKFSMFLTADNGKAAVRVYRNHIAMSPKKNRVYLDEYASAALHFSSDDPDYIAFDGPAAEQGLLLPYLATARKKNANYYVVRGLYANSRTIDIYQLYYQLDRSRHADVRQELNNSETLITGKLHQVGRNQFSVELLNLWRYPIQPQTAHDTKLLRRFAESNEEVVVAGQLVDGIVVLSHIHRTGDLRCHGIFLRNENLL